MAGNDWFGDVAVFAFDIVGFTKFDAIGQVHAKKLTSDVLDEAAEETGTKVAQTMWADAGDGGCLLLSGDPRQALRMLERFVRLIEQRNALLLEEARVHLRYALHYGPVFKKGAGRKQQLIGDAINDCARLLSGIAKDRIGQVVASGAYRDKVLTFGTVHAGLFTRLPDITDKHEKRHEVWNVCQKPGFGIEVPAEAPPDRPR